jgi:hypothetical protein
LTPAATVRGLLSRSAGLIRADAGTLAALTIWAFAPLVATAVYVAIHGGILTGANGADFFDQFQYLAWIRDEGNHLLASNLWVIGGTSHDYVQPMYLISGLLWRLGLSVQLAYLIWKPIALLVLFLGFAAYTRRMLGGRRAATGALVLALFYESPLFAVASWTGHLSSAHRLALVLTTDDATSALNLWGFEHAAIAIGLMPVVLLGSERLLAGAQLTGRIDRRWTAVVALAGLLVAWLHPWQAVTLLVILAAVWLRRPSRRRLAVLVVPVAATVVPLVYGVALSRFDPWWSSFQSQSTATGTGAWWALLASFAPLVAFAAAGYRRPREDGDWMLMLWPAACAAVYFVVPQFPPHALAGVTLPLAVLAVRGWSRIRAALRVPVHLARGLAVAAVAAGCLPAAVLHAQDVRADLSGTVAGALARQQFRLTADQAAAVAYLAHAPRSGGVLAPWLLSMSVPGLTGRTVYAGHPQWQPHAHVAVDGVFFDPGLNDPTGRLRRAILRSSRAVFVVADCHEPAQLAHALAPVTRPVRRFGCVAVYETY